MRRVAPDFRFRSDLFPIERGEDKDTNPGCCGRALAEWLRARFLQLGYAVEDVIAEDWGWCVMLARQPCMLWIGCCSLHDGRLGDEAGATPAQPVEWCCIVKAEAPVWSWFFWQRLLGRADARPFVARVTAQLEAALRAEPRITGLTPAAR